ncbi:MAG: HAMP domain-containing sensor histidine kinase [Gammaproteobacteria bacterium]
MKRDPSRFLQIGFLGLLFLCVLQVGYWMTENFIYTNTVQDQLEALTAGEVPAADSLELIAAESEGRNNRYLWEGSFFLVVLLGGMGVLTRTLRHDTELRRRQQNFLAAVSHEFKSPLASMQLAAETLVMRADEPDAKRLGQRILEDCERLLRMVENLLDTTRIEEGRHELGVEQTDLASVVTAVVDSFAERAARHSVEIGHSVPGAISLAVDRQALDTILRNLVDNALKACIAGNGHRIDVRVESIDGRIELAVADDGLGFAPEDANLMFEKFHRLGDELRRKTPGTGLGLYIVKKLAELSGARIRAESAGPGSGAEIALSWPERGAA